MISILETVNKKRTIYGKKDKIHFSIVQIGAGANGGYILQHVTQMMNIFGVEGSYLIADPDVVEEKNLANQLFVQKDVGQMKATVLARRYRAHYNLDIASYDQEFIEDVESLQRLFKALECKYEYNSSTFYLPVLIGAVDNEFTRKVMYQFFNQSKNIVYIDVGVDGVWLPPGDRHIKEWTRKEILRHLESGYEGQVVCGLRLDDQTLMASVGDFFGEIEVSEEMAPSLLACSNTVASSPQLLITNRFAALHVAAYFNELFTTNSISSHITFFGASAANPYVRAVPAEICDEYEEDEAKAS